MAIITTKSIADSKPITPLDWCGNPIKDGRSYWGNEDASQDAVSRSVEAPGTRPDEGPATMPRKRRRRRGIMSPEQRAAFGDRMRAYWQRKRGNLPSVEATPAQSEVITSDNG
jgi:hypothetical protein